MKTPCATIKTQHSQINEYQTRNDQVGVKQSECRWKLWSRAKTWELKEASCRSQRNTGEPHGWRDKRWASNPAWKSGSDPQCKRKLWGNVLKNNTAEWALWATPVTQWVKSQGTQETVAGSLDREDPLEKDMATRSGILAWHIPWTEEPGGLQSMSQTCLSD